MARQGRFARTSSGSQNMSSLIYSLLREERNNQEESMLTAYTNNMRSGTTRNTFTSGGNTNAATAGSLYDWYVSQAELARDTGDSTGYDRLMQKAEQFRLSALKDKEDLARSAYSYGTSVDRSLFGSSGTGPLDLSEYEKILDQIASDPSMTDADKSRITLSKFNASYNFTSAELIRKYKAGTTSADSLVAFYNKELARAKAAGFTESSQQYQEILNARSDAQERSKADGAKARVDAVGGRIKDEQLALAKAIQSLVSPIVDRFFSSKTAAEAVKAEIKGDGQDWLVTLLNLFDANSGKSLSTLIKDAGLSAGWDQGTIDTFYDKINAFSDEVQALYAAGFVEETKLLRQLSGIISQESAQGTYNVAMQTATESFTTAINQAGGSINQPFSADPYKFTAEFNSWKGASTAVSELDRYEDILLADQVARIGSGNLVDLFPGTKATNMSDFIDEVAAATGLDRQSVISSLGLLSTNINDYWNSNDSALQLVATALNSMSNGTIRSNLQLGISGGGTATIGTVFGGAATAAMVAEVDKDPNLVFAYQFNPQSRQTQMVPVQTSSVSGDSSYSTFSTTGNPNELIYVKREQVLTEKDGAAGDPVTINGQTLYYVPIPGGSNFAGSTGSSMDSNDYLEFVANGNTFRLTLADLETFMGDSGIAGSTPRIISTNSGGVITISAALASQLGGTRFNQWLISGYGSKGSDWYNKIVTVGKDTTGSNESVKSMANDYAQKILSQIPADYNGNLDAVVKSYLTRFGVSDKAGKILSMVTSIISPKLLNPAQEAYKEKLIQSTGGQVPDTSYINNNNYPGSAPTLPGFGYGSQQWRDNTGFQLPQSLPQNTPPSPTITSSSAPALTPPRLQPSGPLGPVRDQIGGQDYFFRNLGGVSINPTNPIKPQAQSPIRGLGSPTKI